VALARALSGVGAIGVGLKWPNDVLLERQGEFAKLAGILIELSSDRRGTQAIIGIGLNLVAPQGDLPQPAAGLSAAGVSIDRHDILAAVLMALANVLDRFDALGFAALHEEWQGFHAWQGLSVQIFGDDVALNGHCMGVDADGALLIDTARGIERIYSGDVSLRRA
jgi:BirA family biotin operon repressor/biotin-[acetyl-CoA-carboxylase] ligase